MGFWNGLVKVVQGKPVFEAPTDGVQPEGTASTKEPKTAAPGTDATGHKIIPEVEFEHCKSRVDGQNIEVTAWVTNRSAVEIELDKMTMLGMTTELDRIFSPNEGREMRLYKGKVPTHDDDEMAYLQYKKRSDGDYFQASFIMEFDYDPDGFYTVSEFRPANPVRDI